MLMTYRFIKILYQGNNVWVLTQKGSEELLYANETISFHLPLNGWEHRNLNGNHLENVTVKVSGKYLNLTVLH